METKTSRSQTSSREKILASATTLFIRNGYQATSVDDILAGCGVAKSNFYYHFKSKEDLACAVLDRRFEEYEQMMRSSLSAYNLTPTQRLDKFFYCLMEGQAGLDNTTGCPFGNFAASLSMSEEEQNERFRIRLCQLFRRIEGYMHACLLEGAARGEFRNDIAPLDLANHLVATLQGLLMLTKTFQNPTMLREGMAIAQQIIKK